MKVRLAEERDVDAIVAMGATMHEESRFRIYPANRTKMAASVRQMIQNPARACILLALQAETRIAGMLAGYVADFFFSDALMAQDKFFYVHPAHRGSSAALKLLIAFRRWAENRHAAELCINMSVDIEQERFNRFMRHLSFRACGANFFIPLQSASGAIAIPPSEKTITGHPSHEHTTR